MHGSNRKHFLFFIFGFCIIWGIILSFFVTCSAKRKAAFESVCDESVTEEMDVSENSQMLAGAAKNMAGRGNPNGAKAY